MERNLAKQEAIASEMKADNAKLRSEMRDNNSQFRNEIGELRTEIRLVDERVNSVNARVDSVQTTVYWGFTVLTLFWALTTFTPALLEFIKGLRKPSVTMEDVERVVNAAIAQAQLEGK